MNISSDDIERFRRDGFLRLRKFTTVEDLAVVQATLDPLFAEFNSLPRRMTNELAAGDGTARQSPRIPEIIRPTALHPGLSRSQVFASCKAAARRLLGVPVGCVFDHAIYKPPHNEAPTMWHQDDAYAGRPVPLRTVHFWIPLQSVTTASGCMWFVPGSNRKGRVRHTRVSAGSGQPVLAVREADTRGAVPCPLNAGDVTVHDPLTLHYTGPNGTDDCRRAWIVHFGAYGRLGTLHPRNLYAKLRRATDSIPYRIGNT